MRDAIFQAPGGQKDEEIACKSNISRQKGLFSPLNHDICPKIMNIHLLNHDFWLIFV